MHAHLLCSQPQALWVWERLNFIVLARCLVMAGLLTVPVTVGNAYMGYVDVVVEAVLTTLVETVR